MSRPEDQIPVDPVDAAAIRDALLELQAAVTKALAALGRLPLADPVIVARKHTNRG